MHLLEWAVRCFCASKHFARMGCIFYVTGQLHSDKLVQHWKLHKIKKLLLAAPLFIRAHHNRWIHMFYLADFLHQMPVLKQPQRVLCLLPGLNKGSFTLLGDCVNYYTMELLFWNIHYYFKMGTVLICILFHGLFDFIYLVWVFFHIFLSVWN